MSSYQTHTHAYNRPPYYPKQAPFTPPTAHHPAAAAAAAAAVALAASQTPQQQQQNQQAGTPIVPQQQQQQINTQPPPNMVQGAQGAGAAPGQYMTQRMPHQFLQHQQQLLQQQQQQTPPQQRLPPQQQQQQQQAQQQRPTQNTNTPQQQQQAQGQQQNNSINPGVVQANTYQPGQNTPNSNASVVQQQQQQPQAQQTNTPQNLQNTVPQQQQQQPQTTTYIQAGVPTGSQYAAGPQIDYNVMNYTNRMMPQPSQIYYSGYPLAPQVAPHHGYYELYSQPTFGPAQVVYFPQIQTQMNQLPAQQLVTQAAPPQQPQPTPQQVSNLQQQQQAAQQQQLAPSTTNLQQSQQPTPANQQQQQQQQQQSTQNPVPTPQHIQMAALQQQQTVAAITQSTPQNQQQVVNQQSSNTQVQLQHQQQARNPAEQSQQAATHSIQQPHLNISLPLYQPGAAQGSQPYLPPNVGVHASYAIPTIPVAQQAPNMFNPYAAPPPVAPTYTKRERKPLTIVDPTTKQPLNMAQSDSSKSNQPDSKSSTGTSTNTTSSSSTSVPSSSSSSSSSTATIPSSTSKPTVNNNAEIPSTSNKTNNSTNNANNTTAPSSTSATTATTTKPVADKAKQPDIQAQLLKNLREASTSSNTTSAKASTTTPASSASVPTTVTSASSTPASATIPTTTDTNVTSSTTSTPVAPSTIPKTTDEQPPASTATSAKPTTPPSYSLIVAQEAPKTAIPTSQPKQAVPPTPATTTTTTTSTAATTPAPVPASATTQSKNDTNNNKTKKSEDNNESTTTAPITTASTATTAPTSTVQETSASITTVTPAVDNKKPTETATKTDNDKKVETISAPAAPAPVEQKLDEQTVPPTTASTTAAPTATTTENGITFWTPENKEGRKRYDREFLLSLKDKKLSKVCPEALKSLEIIFQDPNLTQQKSYMSGNMGVGGMNSLDNRPISRNSYNDRQNQFDRRSIKKQPSSMRPGTSNDARQGPPMSFKEDVKLKKVDNPYVIRKLTNKEQTELDDLFREVRNILNKLTPQNIQKLTSDLIALPINTEERLKGAIDIIFEKSIDEQVFSQTYAQLCKVLQQIKVQQREDPTKSITFRTMLLTRCQKEFDTDYYQDINYDKMLQEIEECQDEQKKRELKELGDEKLFKAKRRSLGNIRFIGELFKLGMLTEGIMNNCIDRLLKQENDEENLECLCRLLSTIGKEVDKQSNAALMKNYFERLEKITKKNDNKKVSARIRFMILDVIDLRRNAWVPRRKDNNPRRIEEIRREAEEEQAAREAEIQRNQAMEKRQGGGQKGLQQKGGYQQGHQQHQQQHHSLKSTSMDSETFHMRSTKTQNGNMVSKIKDVKSITTKNLNSTDLLLGPSGGTGFSWSKPKPAAVTATQQSDSSTLPTSSSFSTNLSSNQFSKTIDQYSSLDHQRTGFPPRRTMEATSFAAAAAAQPQQAGSRLSMDSNKYGSTNKQVQNVKRMDDTIKSETSSQASSRDTSRSNSQTRGDSNVNTTSSNKKSQSYTIEEIERKANNTIEEYIQNKDIGEALRDFDDFKPVDQSQYVEFIEQMITIVIERSDSARQAVGQLFFNALKENKIETKSLSQGIKNIFDLAEDMAIDVPKIATYLSQIIAPLFEVGYSVEFLADAFEPIKDKKIGAELISEVLHQASNRLGHSSISEIFKSSNLRINYFLGGVSNVTDFLRENNIAWIHASRERTQSASVSTESYEKKLYEILENSKLDNETIFEKIENEFNDADCVTKPFIRALVIAVCRSCLVDNKIDAFLFKNRTSILTKFIGKKEELELEALFAVQAVDHKMKHLPGFIRLLFDMLYDEDIIREDVFHKWKQDVREEGHAISVLALKGFYEWLSEADSNDAAQ